MSVVTVGSGLNTSGGPFQIVLVNSSALLVYFGTIQNLPGSPSKDDYIEMFLRFKTANEALILSGRQQFINVAMVFPGVSQAAVKEFMISGPLVKPLLSIVKRIGVSAI